MAASVRPGPTRPAARGCQMRTSCCFSLRTPSALVQSCKWDRSIRGTTGGTKRRGKTGRGLTGRGCPGGRLHPGAGRRHPQLFPTALPTPARGWLRLDRSRRRHRRSGRRRRCNWAAAFNENRSAKYPTKQRSLSFWRVGMRRETASPPGLPVSMGSRPRPYATFGIFVLGDM